MVKKEKLFDQFPPVTTDEWMDKIRTDLKGADLNKRLIWRTYEGFEVKPFYRMEDVENLKYINTLPGEFPYLRGTKSRNNNWLVRQDIEVTNYSEANRKALAILMKGIDSLGFIITDTGSIDKKNFDLLLERIFLGGVEINISSSGKAKEILDLIINYVRKSRSDPDEFRGAIETDPLSRLMVNGSLCIPPEEGLDYLASLIKSSASLPHFRMISINASNFNNAGADIVQELAFGISMGSEYLAQMTQRRISADMAASKIGFCFGTGSDYFPEIAKLRAARLLWSVVINGFHPENIEKIRMNVHCVTSKWNKTVYDPYVNLLRTQTEAMSAILGGADSLTVEPFDIVFRNPDEFSERIARNQQLILKEEAYFDKVADPAAGSYYIENLTNLISENAWKLFLEIEEKGGFLSCLKSGFIQNTISESATKRRNDSAIRKNILLGTNHYPDLHEKISDTVDLNKIFSKKPVNPDCIVDPISLSRGSQQYEKLRITIDGADWRPVVFLLPIGNPAMRNARSQFSANFFGCAGYQIIDNKGFESVGEAVKEAIKSKADIVVVCSSDEEYPLFAPDIYNRLNGKAITVIAGHPAMIEELRSKGLENFIHLRSNVIEILTGFNEQLGITRGGVEKGLINYNAHNAHKKSVPQI
jgi:methylmalonyl-CoA mutase